MVPLNLAIITVIIIQSVLLSIIFAAESPSCQNTKLGCNCHNVAVITAENVTNCCNNQHSSLIVTGFDLRNLSINLRTSACASKFTNLFIRDTGIVTLSNHIKGLGNLINVFIENNANISDLDSFVFSKVSQKIASISVDTTTLRSISEKTFRELNNVTSLRLSNNQLGFINNGAFSDMVNLKQLYLNDNYLTKIDPDIFSGLSNLQILDLNKNPLQKPPNNIFQYLKNLTFLKMSLEPKLFVKTVGMNILPNQFFFSMKKLMDLNMTMMKIENLTSLTFYGLAKLNRLTMTHNLLRVIPPGALQHIPMVKIINLSHNELVCLGSDTFRSLPYLKDLDLSYNKLSYISEATMKYLGNTRMLDIRENNIYVIEPNALGYLSSLMVLNLNVVLGRARIDIRRDVATSPIARLKKATQINGLYELFGLSNGLDAKFAPKPESGKVESVAASDSCPVATLADRQWPGDGGNGSRRHLLIIVGVCVLFLLVALAVIMTYRAWSKRKTLDDDDDKQPQSAVAMPLVTVVGNGDKAASSNCDAASRDHDNYDETALTPLGVL